MSDRLQWPRDGLDWPMRENSRLVTVHGLRWHVQTAPAAWLDTRRAGARPLVVLLHGTGSSTHSWRDVLPLLQDHARVLSLDLPGHAFTDMPAREDMSLPGMAARVGGLLEHLGLQPALLVGHSAGAAIAVQMVLDRLCAPAAVVSLNGALLPLGGLAGQLFSPAARVLARVPGVPELFAWRAGDEGVVRRLMDSTGSRLDARGLALYGRLVRNPGHAAGALAMMSRWDLQAFSSELPRFHLPLHLVVGSADQTVPPAQADQVARIVPTARVSRWDGLGHLAHEEQPARAAAWIAATLRQL